MTESKEGASPKLPRYFYTDPLAAAWMAKHFGMRFTAWNGKSRAYNEIQVLPLIDSENHYQRLVHPDSLPLLEPRESDEGFDSDGRQCYFRDGKWFVPHTVASSADEDATLPIAIDKRNGIAFLWPESEAA